MVIARHELASGHVISTAYLSGTNSPYESVAFAPGWPFTGDELVRLRATRAAEALSNHAALVERFEPEDTPDLTDPNWVFRLLGLPPRRYPRGRP